MTTTAMDIGQKELPAGWKWVRLGDICEVILGQSPPGSTYRKTPEGLPFFQGKAEFGEVSPTATTWCVEPKKIAEAGDILISVRAPVGPTNVADAKCCIGRGLAALRCTKKADKDFILAGLKLFETQIALIGSGSTFSAITGKQLREIPIPLPPLEEQKRISAILNEQMATVEKIKKAAEKRLEAAKALPAAYLREVFPASEDELPAGWKRVELGDVSTMRQIGIVRSVSEQGDKRSIPYLKMNNITSDGNLDFSETTKVDASEEEVEKYLLREGDFLFNTRNSKELVGKTAVFNLGGKPWIFNNNIMRLRFSENVRPTFLGLCFQSSLIKNQLEQYKANTTNICAIYDRQVKEIRIPLPPLEEQKRITAILNEQMAAVEKVKKAAEQELDTIGALPASLLRKAFSGKL